MLGKRKKSVLGGIYVQWLLMAEEPNFRFPTTPHSSIPGSADPWTTNGAPSRDTLYSHWIKEILKKCRPRIWHGLDGRPGPGHLGAYTRRGACKDVRVHARRVLQGPRKGRLRHPMAAAAGERVLYATADGYQPLVVPEAIANAIGPLTDLDGKPVFNLGRVEQEFNQSLHFEFRAARGPNA